MTAKGMIVLAIGLSLIVIMKLGKSSGNVFDALADIEDSVINAKTKDDVIRSYTDLTRVMATGWHRGHKNESRRIYKLIQKKYNENLSSM